MQVVLYIHVVDMDIASVCSLACMYTMVVNSCGAHYAINIFTLPMHTHTKSSANLTLSPVVTRLVQHVLFFSKSIFILND